MGERRVVLAEYFMVEDRTLVFIVRADYDEPHVEEIVTPPQTLRDFVTANFGTLDNNRSAVQALDLDDFQALFGPFVEKIGAHAAPDDIVWLVPHDVLHYVPLHAVKIGGQPLIERNPVCYTPSASVMKYCHQNRRARRDRALVLGDSRDDLPYAREEARTVARMFGTTAHLGADATKELVTTALRERRDEVDILHLACHGEFNQIQALQSRVLLAPPPADPGSAAADADPSAAVLTAEEIFGLEMRADLVTLSACETGVNERKPGDELIGLTRALIYAGTPSVVVSLWKVDDLAAQILMERFYRGLKDGKMKAEALQQAQIDTMRMTAREVIDHFTAMRDQLGADATPDHVAEAEDRIDRAHLRLAGVASHLPVSQRPDVRLLERVYDWAPFVLIGDWR